MPFIRQIDAVALSTAATDMSANSAEELRRIYEMRFTRNIAQRKRIWGVLVPAFFQKFIAGDAAVLDLGCGYGEFINTVRCGRKLAMDLNPDAPRYLNSDVEFLEQDCSAAWAVETGSLDAVFTSNFFEHLPHKAALGRTLDEVFRCLVPGGRLIAMGPNVRFLPGDYWDFWDHHLALSERSLNEGLTNRGFEIAECFPQFLPYTMANSREYPDFVLKAYLKLPLAWHVFGKQFLVVAEKPGASHQRPSSLPSAK